MGRGRRGSVTVIGWLLAAALCVVLAACSSSPAPAPPTAPPPAPGPAPSLLGWKLTLPQSNGKGDATTVEPAVVSPPWLTTDPAGNLVFWAPVAGATTEHSDHPRTELDNLQNFQAGTGPNGLAASASVAKVPASNQDVIIGQVHGAADISSVPFVMLHYTGGVISVVVKEHQSGNAHLDYPLLPDVPLNARFDFGIRDNGDGTLTFSASYDGQNESQSVPIPADFTGATVRFQAGAYQQGDQTATPATPDDGARLTFYTLRTGADAVPPPPPPSAAPAPAPPPAGG